MSFVGADDLGTFIGADHAAFSASHVNRSIENSEPQYETYAALIEAQNSDHLKDVIARQSENIIKRCKQCSKACASSPLMPSCNGCGAELPDEETTSLNVFNGFVYGVKKGPFPFNISLRAQMPTMMVFDDLLAASSCHLNVISTQYYIIDWRFLLLNPKKGLNLINEMEAAAQAVVRDTFWANEAWKKKYIYPDYHPLSSAAILQYAFAGMNFPPSQFQLHLQYILPPLLPYQYQLYLEGKHATKHRFFPLTYIRKVLQTDVSMNVNMKTDVLEIIEKYNKLGVSYDKIYQEAYNSLGANHRRLAYWKRKDFSMRLRDGKLYDASSNKDLGLDVHGIVAEDKLTLQNYGRPYAGDKPTGTYYKYARKTPLETWDDSCTKNT